jgi:hypothetical protein
MRMSQKNSHDLPPPSRETHLLSISNHAGANIDFNLTHLVLKLFSSDLTTANTFRNKCGFIMSNYKRKTTGM